MEKENIDLFDIYAGRILNELLGSFPIPKDLEVPNIVLKRVGEQEQKHHQYIIYHTIKWLGDEDFIRYGTSTLGMELYTDVILTSKGLEVLKQAPKTISDNPTLASRLKQAVETGSDELIKKSSWCYF